MDFFSLFKLLGGLALFLYGMSIMGSGLEKLSGGRLENILEKMTDRPIKGVLLGTAVTAVIQSSSATSVMVVGFVNSGIMQLSNAVGIIMGANIGTTATSWILSLTGLESSNPAVAFFKPSNFSPLIAFIGIIFIMASKKSRKKDIGAIMVGFALLMYGMNAMSSAVEPLSEVPEFTNILLMFSNPILGVLAGAIFTAIIQSSSASVGILQAISATGVLTYGTAIPIILGENIGTCVTALLSCIGTSKNAKRAAMVHFYFNVIGTALFLIVFYTLNAFISFSFINSALTPVSIAIIHTIFNLLTTAVLLPFSKQLVKLASISVKDNAKEELFPKLDERFLASPSFAVEQCMNVTDAMAELAKDTLFDSMNVFGNYDEKTAEKINGNEDLLDKYEDKLGTYLVKLSSKPLSEDDSAEISRMLHSIGDFERIGDHAVNILDLANEMHTKGISFSDDALSEIEVLSSAAREIIEMAIRSYVNNDAELAKHVEPLEQVIDTLREEMKTRHIQRLQNGKCTIELGFIFSDLITNFERISDHCSNIAVCVIEIKESSFDTHSYLNSVKYKTEGQFADDFKAYSGKYTLR